MSTKYNDSPQFSSRPFDKDRDGFVMGEGSGIIILEELEHAIKRKAKIYCVIIINKMKEMIGYGNSSDPYHITVKIKII